MIPMRLEFSALHVCLGDEDTFERMQGLSVEEMVARVTGAAENGSIILFHNDVKNTPEALRQCLQALSAQGYQFVTVEELLYWDNYRIDAAGKQHKVAA